MVGTKINGDDELTLTQALDLVENKFSVNVFSSIFNDFHSLLLYNIK